jgi:CubicO group peptidase (beta-lactamase class C family)
MNRNFRFVIARACALVLLSSEASAQTPSPSPATTPAAPSAHGSDELAGLWKAKRWFGSFERSRLIIQRNGGVYTADMLGRMLPVRMDKGEITFALPDGQGKFRGKLQGGGIHGQWIRAQASGSGGGSASPVFLKADAPNRWSGQVVPGREEFTLYLMAQKRPDGSLGLMLGNPERDIGSQFGVERLTRDGNVVKLLGKRRGQQEDVEVASGTYDPDNQVITLGFPDRGGSYDFKREGDESDFYARGKTPGPYAYRPPPALDDGWLTGTLEEANIDRAGIERLIQVLLDAPMDSVGMPKIHALLIARHGKLVLEEYFRGENRERLHQIYSAGKSVTAAIVGAAMQAGAPLTLSSRVYEVMNGGSLPPGLEPGKREMTLEHLLTMSSGYFCDDNNDDAPGNEERMQTQTEEPDFYRYTMKVPLATPPGEKAVYCSASANLALGMVGRATGESQLDTFDRLIGVPLKIRRYTWWVVPSGDPYGAGGNAFLARDFMKFGQLMLNGGTWQGRRILSREFVARASAPLYHLWGWQYGYLWWGIDYPYKDRTVHAFFAGGSGGQVVIVIPELDLLIATFGGNYFSSGGWYVQVNITPQFLLPAVREAGDDKNAPVVPRKDFAPKRGPETESGPIKLPR